MNIRINGKDEMVENSGSLADLVEYKGFKKNSIVIEHNLNVVPKEQWSDVILSDGDNLEIVSFVGGG